MNLFIWDISAGFNILSSVDRTDHMNWHKKPKADEENVELLLLVSSYRTRWILTFIQSPWHSSLFVQSTLAAWKCGFWCSHDGVVYAVVLVFGFFHPLVIAFLGATWKESSLCMIGVSSLSHQERDYYKLTIIWPFLCVLFIFHFHNLLYSCY